MKPEFTISDNGVYAEQFFLKPGESNAEAEMPLTLLTSRIIDVATNHANLLQIGYATLQPHRQGWVLSRLAIEMKRYPRVNEHYTIRTWIQGLNRMFSERNFQILDGKGDVLGYARTIWMIIDTETHRNVGLSEVHLSEKEINGSDVPMPRQSKHRPVTDGTVSSYTFRYSDIDFYRHVNTVRYVELLANQFSMEQFDTHFPQRFEIAFMHECRYGMTVQIRRAEETDGTVRLEIAHENSILCTSRFVLTARS